MVYFRLVPCSVRISGLELGHPQERFRSFSISWPMKKSSGFQKHHIPPQWSFFGGFCGKSSNSWKTSMCHVATALHRRSRLHSTAPLFGARWSPLTPWPGTMSVRSATANAVTERRRRRPGAPAWGLGGQGISPEGDVYHGFYMVGPSINGEF